MSNHFTPDLRPEVVSFFKEANEKADQRLSMLKTIFHSGQLNECPFCHAILEVSGNYDDTWVINHTDDCRFKNEVITS